MKRWETCHLLPIPILLHRFYHLALPRIWHHDLDGSWLLDLFLKVSMFAAFLKSHRQNVPAPFSSSTFTEGRCPFRAAQCSAVFPALFWVFNTASIVVFCGDGSDSALHMSSKSATENYQQLFICHINAKVEYIPSCPFAAAICMGPFPLFSSFAISNNSATFIFVLSQTAIQEGN